MSGRVLELAGGRVLLYAADAPVLADDRDVSDLIGEAYGAGVDLIALPATCLGPDFLDLRTGRAGQILQKLVNYRFRVVILGDIAGPAAGSTALRDFVRESNRGQTIWFLPDLAALEEKLAAQAGG